MLIVKLALRNLLGAGLRTWLNVLVLSTSFIIIIWTKGLLEGWNRQAKADMIKWEMAGGQYWHRDFNPYEPMSLARSHGPIPAGFAGKEIVPVLMAQGTIYPEGRMLPLTIRGIPPDQEILELPTAGLVSENGDIPALLGSAMAESARLDEGDYVTLRWRDKNGTYDAMRVRVASIFKTSVPTVDVGQIWIPIETLQSMLMLPGEATIIISGSESPELSGSEIWIFRDRKFLMADLDRMIKAQKSMGTIMWLILLMMAMLAVFDSQVLSIFKRQKEIGTYVALGMTQPQVVKLFTLEGALHSVLAVFVAAIYGIPVLIMQASNGISIPLNSSDFGVSMTEKLYPVYSAGLIAGTIATVLFVTMVVSYLPARKIALLNPTDSLTGRLQ